jgi:hypothetical protein
MQLAVLSHVSFWFFGFPSKHSIYYELHRVIMLLIAIPSENFEPDLIEPKSPSGLCSYSSLLVKFLNRTKFVQIVVWISGKALCKFAG